MKKRLGILGVLAILVMALFALSAVASEAQLYFSSDKNGQNRVTNIQEGDEVWVVVIDNDQNIDCDIRDKMAPDLKIMDPKTGAYIVWNPDPDFDPNAPIGDYLEETGADTGVFVSKRSFQVGTRLEFDVQHRNTHAVDVDGNDFQWGDYLYVENAAGQAIREPMDPFQENFIGRFENMDTLVGMYQDPNDPGDIALGMMKIIDTKAQLMWGTPGSPTEVYKDANGAAMITVVDPDENLNCNQVEYVPVFIIVNPGSWNPVQSGSPTNFCMLKRTGGVDGKGSRP